MPFSLRRYSITHRAVGRLRELDPTNEGEEDEALRNRIDAAIVEAEAAGRTVDTLDAMHGEPQTVIQLEGFGRTLYAVVKENTVVTLLRRVHGDVVFRRNQAQDLPLAVSTEHDANTGQPESGYAVVGALREAIHHHPPATPLKVLWDHLSEQFRGSLTVGDLIAALRDPPK